MRPFAIVSVIALLAGGAAAGAADTPPAEWWEIGPVIRGRNYSVGMPLQPIPARRGWSFEFPYPDVGAGHVHYVTFGHGPLTGKSTIVMRYRIDAAPGARFLPREHPEYPAAVSLYFQRAGDSWSSRRHGHYRWYAPAQTMRVLAPGDYEIAASLSDGNWISVLGTPATEDPAGFRDAIERADRVGFVFGSAATRGHGVFATGPARFTLVSFRID